MPVSRSRSLEGDKFLTVPRFICLLSLSCISSVSCQKGPTRHAHAWQIGPFWQDTLDMWLLLQFKPKEKELQSVSSLHMMTSSNGNIFRVTGAGNSPVPVNSPHKGQWRGALMFSLICVWINGWVNNRGAGDLRRCRGHYDVIVVTSTELLARGL